MMNDLRGIIVCARQRSDLEAEAFQSFKNDSVSQQFIAHFTSVNDGGGRKIGCNIAHVAPKF